MTPIFLEDNDLNRLLDLYHEAQTTPLIYFAPGRDLASSAWDNVRNFMVNLGRKYGFDPKSVAISTITGEVKLRDE